MKSKKIASMIGTAIAVVSMSLSGIPAYAAVTTMPDGGKFDAAYYAATYPDVTAALGTDANALYQHYKTFGAKEGRLPYAAGTGTTAATAATATTSTLTAAQRRTAQKILREYISGACMWGVMDAIYYKDAKNPRFIITDLNKDGVPELYTNGGEGWDIYNLQTGKRFTAISGYNPSLNMYMDDFGLWTAFWTYDGNSINEVMDIKYYDYDTQQEAITVSYPDGRKQRITEAEAHAIIATFVDPETLVAATPLTAATVNAIK